MSRIKIILLVVLFISVLIVLIPLIYIPRYTKIYTHKYKGFTYTDNKIIELAYNGPKTPAGFYNDRLEQDEQVYDSIYYHMNFTGLSWEFFSTDDYNEAKTLVEHNINNSNTKIKEISEIFECEKYFEFKTVEFHENGKTYILRHRVHKSSYIRLDDPYIIPAWWPNINEQRSIELGTFNLKPIDLRNSKELIEYLWFIENYEISGVAVYDEILKQDNEKIFCIFLEVHLLGGDLFPPDPDIIRLIYSEFSIDIISGTILLSQNVFRQFPTGKL